MSFEINEETTGLRKKGTHIWAVIFILLVVMLVYSYVMNQKDSVNGFAICTGVWVMLIVITITVMHFVNSDFRKRGQNADEIALLGQIIIVLIFLILGIGFYTTAKNQDEISAGLILTSLGILLAVVVAFFKIKGNRDIEEWGKLVDKVVGKRGFVKTERIWKGEYNGVSLILYVYTEVIGSLSLRNLKQVTSFAAISKEIPKIKNDNKFIDEEDEKYKPGMYRKSYRGENAVSVILRKETYEKEIIICMEKAAKK
ncbi:MAG: hypothetical protein Q7S22_00045 [Candidatus Micrarchaeota archaeon]|nr:hypothetical protein [Candidatus Micrarchaeota archaeon]